MDRRGFLRTVGGTAALVSLGGLPLLACEPAPAVPSALRVMERGTFEGGRLLYYRFRTDQVDWDPGVNILLPSNYSSGKRYPVMYLLHGGLQDFRKFHAEDDIVGVTSNREIITVMPDGGGAGWYCDPVRSNNGPRNWESFHIKQLIPWVDANFRTYAETNGRAVSGFSMGGFGALKYLARFPHLFGAVAAHSGPPDLSGVVLNWAETSAASAELLGGTLYGGNQAKITADNPCAQVAKFQGKSILLVCGLDADVNESFVRPGQQKFRGLLNGAGIAHEAHELPGGHFVRREMLHRDYDKAIAKLRKAA